MTQDNQPGCGRQESEILLLLYGELDPISRRNLETHARDCHACAGTMAGLGSTIDTVRRSRLGEMATLEGPGSWPALRAALAASPRPRRERGWPVLARAAAVLLVAGASFAVGRWWDGNLGIGGGRAGEARGDSDGMDSAGRVALFSERTNDYLDRSRMVLLELANGDLGGERLSLSQASRALLQENPTAREVARQIADRRLQQLVDELETILSQISTIQDAGASQADRIRTYVNNSGVLEQLEVLSAVPERLASTRRRT